MGDDFDLFPKRENLDPFSFGKSETEEKKAEPEDKKEDLFGEDDRGLPPLPDPPLFSTQEDGPPAAEDAAAEPPASPEAEPQVAEPEKTFDEPVFDAGDTQPDAVPEDQPKKAAGKSPSPFLLVGGALVIIIGLLYGALTYLNRDRRPPVQVQTPQVSIPVQTASPAPEPREEAPPEPQPEAATESASIPAAEPGAAGGGGESAVEKTGDESGPAAVSEPPREPQSPRTAAAPTETVKTPPPPPPEPPAAQAGRYSVQVGALILQSSITELQKRLSSAGYTPYMKKGSTTASMTTLMVGPFGDRADAQRAVSRLRSAGIEALMRRGAGGYVIDAGSYLVRENAREMQAKIRSVGYPVRMGKTEKKLPMTFVRIGRFDDRGAADSLRAELRSKGFEAIVVKVR